MKGLDLTYETADTYSGFDRFGRITQESWRDYTAPDARGNMTTVSKPVDMTATYACTYDAWDRLVEVKDGNNVIARYEYDGLNRRVKKHVDSQAPASPDGIDTYRHFFHNRRWQVLETRESSSENTEPEGLDPLCQYVWSLRYIDAPILRDENKDADGDCIDGGDERLYYLTDANMNVTCLVDTAGEAVERYLYDPYGAVTFFDGSWTPRSASAYDNSILFCGYYRDKETGLYHVRHRMYHPTLGRWMQRDPIGYRDGANLYELGTSCPISHVDPYGLEEWPSSIGPAPTGPSSVPPDDYSDTDLGYLAKQLGHNVDRFADMTYGVAKAQALARLGVKRAATWIENKGKNSCSWTNCGSIEGPGWNDYGTAVRIVIDKWTIVGESPITPPAQDQWFVWRYRVAYYWARYRVRDVFYKQLCDKVCTSRETGEECTRERKAIFGTSDRFVNILEDWPPAGLEYKYKTLDGWERHLGSDPNRGVPNMPGVPGSQQPPVPPTPPGIVGGR